MKQQIFKKTRPELEAVYGPERTGSILTLAEERYRTLCQDNAADPKAVRSHTEGKIYPYIALYETMQAQGIPAPEALAFLDRTCSAQAEPQAAQMRAAMKIPGLYHLMPSIFRFVTVHTFGTKAGFAATFYPTGRDRIRFDMTRCLYCDVCRKYGHPELVPCFCHTDDVTNGRIHPKLCWHRTKIMGGGDDVCDFELYVKKE